MNRIFGWMVISTTLTICPMLHGQGAEGSAEKQPQGSHESKAVQDSQGDQAFRLSFVVRELDENGKIANSRSYDTMVTTGNSRPPSIRVGSKIPIATGGGATSEYTYTYIDVGINFDIFNVRVVGDRLGLGVSGQISSYDASRDDPRSVNTAPKVILQNTWYGNVLIPFGERRIIFSGDDLTSKRKLQVELTATRVN